MVLLFLFMHCSESKCSCIYNCRRKVFGLSLHTGGDTTIVVLQ